MRFLFLNQYFPPDPAPTGALLGEVARRLEERGHTVDFVFATQAYRAGQQRGGRMRRELRALVQVTARGLRRPRADVVVSGSSPPCLLVGACIVAARHRARSVHWAMDLYPDLAVRLGELRQGAPAAGLRRLVGWAYKHTDIVVALDQDMVNHLSHAGIDAQVIRPWVVEPVAARLAAALSHGSESHRKTPDAWSWVYSGNLGRAHEWETLLHAQAKIEKHDENIRLVFQGGGPSWPMAQSRAAELGLKRCEWRDYVSADELPAALLEGAVCVATQRPETRGLLWPSKLALLLALGRPIVFVGPTHGAIAALVKLKGHRAIFAPGESERLADWLMEEKRTKPAAPARLDAVAHREESLEAWMRFLLP